MIFHNCNIYISSESIISNIFQYCNSIFGFESVFVTNVLQNAFRKFAELLAPPRTEQAFFGEESGIFGIKYGQKA